MLPSPVVYERGMRRTGPLNERLNVPVRPELLEALDEWRRQQRDLPNRAEAVRRLLEQALGIAEDGAPSS